MNIALYIFSSNINHKNKTLAYLGWVQISLVLPNVLIRLKNNNKNIVVCLIKYMNSPKIYLFMEAVKECYTLFYLTPEVSSSKTLDKLPHLV